MFSILSYIFILLSILCLSTRCDAAVVCSWLGVAREAPEHRASTAYTARLNDNEALDTFQMCCVGSIWPSMYRQLVSVHREFQIKRSIATSRLWKLVTSFETDIMRKRTFSCVRSAVYGYWKFVYSTLKTKTGMQLGTSGAALRGTIGPDYENITTARCPKSCAWFDLFFREMAVWWLKGNVPENRRLRRRSAAHRGKNSFRLITKISPR